MSERTNGLLDHRTRQEKADQKVKDQEGVVRRADGSSFRHSEDRRRLDGTRHEVSADPDRTLLYYDDETAKVVS